MASGITVYRGADKVMRFTWTDAVGAPLEVSEVTVICKFPALQFSVIPIDLLIGTFDVKLEGTEPLIVGDYPFSVRALGTDGNTLATPEVIINVR